MSKPGPVLANYAAPTNFGQTNKAYFKVLGARGKADCCVSGRDYIGQMSFPVSGTAPAGTTIFNMGVSPSALQLQETRLGLFGRMFEKFKFKKLAFHLTVQTPTSNQGSYIMAYDHDASDTTPPVSENGIRSLMAYQDSVSNVCWQNSTLKCTVQNDPQDFFYTNYLDEEERVAFQGQIYLTILTGYNVASFGSLWMEYEVDLFQPQLELDNGAELKHQILTTPTISSTINAAWNNLVPGTLVQNSPFVGLFADSNGNIAARFLKAGTYVVEQLLKGQGSAVANGLNPSTFVPNTPGENAVITLLDSITSPAAALAGVVRKEKIIVPEHGGRLYGNLTFTDSYANQILRIFESPSTFV